MLLILISKLSYFIIIIYNFLFYYSMDRTNNIDNYFSLNDYLKHNHLSKQPRQNNKPTKKINNSLIPNLTFYMHYHRVCPKGQKGGI